MEELFNINLDKIPISSKKEKSSRKKNLEIFLESGFPNKKDEDLQNLKDQSGCHKSRHRE